MNNIDSGDYKIGDYLPIAERGFPYITIPMEIPKYEIINKKITNVLILYYYKDSKKVLAYEFNNSGKFVIIKKVQKLNEKGILAYCESKKVKFKKNWR